MWIRRSALAALTSAIASVIVAGPAAATTHVTVHRSGGANSDVIAAQTALDYWGANTPDVVIASDIDWPGQLASSYLAGSLQAPLVTTPAAALPAATVYTLGALGARRALVIGGSAAVSDNVISQLTAMGISATRIAGADRYAEAAAIAATPPAASIGLINGHKAAFIVSGANFPDALSAPATAYAGSFPVLLTDPSTLSLPTQSALSSLGIGEAVIFGGSAAVSDGVASSIASMGISVERFAGVDRYDTNSIVLASVARTVSPSPSAVFLADGDTFADALIAGPAAGHVREDVLLTNGGGLASTARSFLSAGSSAIDQLNVVGNTTDLANTTVDAADVAAGNVARVPDPVPAVSAAAGNASAVLSITAPGDDGGSAITGYRVSVNGAAPVALAANNTVSGLTDGKSYVFAVAACNAVGCQTTLSPVSNAVVPIGPPKTPTMGMPTMSVSTLTWHWTPNSTVANPTVAYRISLDGGAYFPYLSTTFSRSLSLGTHTLSVEATNSVGVSSPVSSTGIAV